MLAFSFPFPGFSQLSLFSASTGSLKIIDHVIQEVRSSMRENHTGLGSRLGMLRERTSLTQKDIAHLVQVSHITVKNWENERYKPSAEHLKHLIEVYLQQKAFSRGYERAEAEELWQMAALNAEFDRGWFAEVQMRQIEAMKQAQNVALEADTPETRENTTLSTQTYSPLSGVDKPSTNRNNEQIFTGNNVPLQSEMRWENLILYVDTLSLKHQDRLRMLDKIQTMWITGLLEQSLQHVAVIELELAKRPDAVANPWRQPLQKMQQFAPEPVPAVHLLNAYEQANGKLLLLGEPGSGKTTLLLQLTQTLLERARHDTTDPIPVIFHLASWMEKRQPITRWLVEELSIKYHIPPALGQQWVESNQILPLLDGLDEVAPSHYTACVEALNIYLKGHGLVPTVICSRSGNYLNQPGRLLLQSAVEVQPLTRQQVATYLQNTGRQRERLSEALLQDSSLRELASTPLMLRVLTTIYASGTAEYPQLLHTLDVRQQAFAAYIRQTFKQLSHTPYQPEQTIHWLQWLAQQLKRQNQSDFYIELMQIDWLPEYRLRRMYPAFAVGLVYGIFLAISYGISYLPYFALSYVVIVGLLIAVFNMLFYGFFNSVIFRLSANTSVKPSHISPVRGQEIGIKQRVVACLENRVVYGLLNGLLNGILTGLLVGAVSGWICGLFTCAFCATLGKLDPEIRCAEYLSWSWPSMFQNAYKFLGGGLLVGLLYGFVTGRDYLFDPTRLLPSLFLGLGIGLLVGLLMSIRGGFTNRLPNVRNILQPNQGIRNSIRYSLFFGLFFGMAFGLLFGLIYGPILFLILGAEYRSAFPADSGLIYGLSDGLLVASFFWLLSGGIAWIQHTLLRFQLWRRGFIPWNYTSFLEHATSLALLHKVGGGYIFFHRLLQEYFATLDDAQMEQIKGAVSKTRSIHE